MDARIARRSYEDFEPSFERKREEGCDTLVISIPGFTKEQIKVQMDNFGNLKLTGERPLTGERWSRIRKEFRIPDNTSTADIRAKLENGNLYVKFPKLFVKQLPILQDQTAKAEEPEPRKETAAKPKPEEIGKIKETGESNDIAKDAQAIQEEKKDINQIVKSEDKKDASDTGDEKDSELDGLRKRKAVVDETMNAEGKNGVRMMFKKPRHLMVNVGVAVVILIGLAFYVSYKLKESQKGREQLG